MRERAGDRYHAVSLGRLLGRITQYGVIQLERLRKTNVSARAVGWITAGSEVSYIEFFQFFAVRTERLALGRSAPGKCLGKPGAQGLSRQ